MFTTNVKRLMKILTPTRYSDLYKRKLLSSQNGPKYNTYFRKPKVGLEIQPSSFELMYPPFLTTRDPAVKETGNSFTDHKFKPWWQEERDRKIIK